MVTRLLAAAVASKCTRRKVGKLHESPQRALSHALVGALTNGGAVSPSFLNPPEFEEYNGTVNKFIA
jgi:hypothetical protein